MSDLRRSLRATAITIGAFLVFAPTAAGTTFEATFDNDAEGFQTARIDPAGLIPPFVEPSEHFASGGNPGGYVRFADTDSSDQETIGLFIAPFTTTTADYGATISLDFLSTATETALTRGVQFNIVSATGGITCLVDAPSAAWETYEKTVETFGCFTADGGNATQADVEAALDGGQVQVLGDQSPEAGEVSGLDNFSFLGAPDDSTPPETTITSGPADGATITTDSASFEFTSDEAGSTFECKLDSGAFEACASPEDLTGLADGSHTFSVRATDAAGNVDATESTRTFTVDTTPEDTTPPDTTIESGPAEGSTISGASPEFGFSSDEAGSTFECKVDGGSFSSCNSPQEIGPLADGSHTFEVRATDAAGNVDATPATRTFTVDTTPEDTTPPETTITSGPPEGSTISNDSPSFEFTSSEASSTFECAFDFGAYAACTSPRNLTGLADGSHTFQVRATDAAGNTDATPASRTFTVDAEPPPDTIAPEVTIDNVKGKAKNKSAKLEFTGSDDTSAPGDLTFTCQLDDKEPVDCTSPHTFTKVKPGTHVVQVIATDEAGNESDEAIDTFKQKKKKRK